MMLDQLLLNGGEIPSGKNVLDGIKIEETILPIFVALHTHSTFSAHCKTV
jgi:hypothetical protein